MDKAGETITLTASITARQKSTGLMREHIKHCELCLHSLGFDVHVCDGSPAEPVKTVRRARRKNA